MERLSKEIHLFKYNYLRKISDYIKPPLKIELNIYSIVLKLIILYTEMKQQTEYILFFRFISYKIF